MFMALVFTPCFLVLIIKLFGTNNDVCVKLFLALLGVAAAIILALFGHAGVRDHEFKVYIKDLYHDQEIPETSVNRRSIYYTGLFLFTEPLSWIAKLRRCLRRRRDRRPQTIEMAA